MALFASLNYFLKWVFLQCRYTVHTFSWPLLSFAAEFSDSGPHSRKTPYHSLTSFPHLVFIYHWIRADDLICRGGEKREGWGGWSILEWWMLSDPSSPLLSPSSSLSVCAPSLQENNWLHCRKDFTKQQEKGQQSSLKFGWKKSGNAPPLIGKKVSQPPVLWNHNFFYSSRGRISTS